MKNFYLPVVMVFLLGIQNIHAQFQVVHEPGGSAVSRTIVTSDGGVITVQRIDSTHLFRKYDPQGELLWNKLLEDTTAIPPMFDPYEGISTMIANNSGGCIFARFIGTVGLPPLLPGEPADSVWTYINLMELNADGNIVMSSQIEKFQHYGGDLLGAQSLELAVQADGSIFLLVNYDGLNLTFIELYKIGSDGSLIWGRSIGRQSWPGAIPTLSYAMFPEARMTTDIAGNVYIAEREDVGIGELYLAKILPNGDMAWMNEYTYSSGSAKFDGMKVDSDGMIHAGGSLMSPVGDFAFFSIISSDGDMERADLYRISYDLQSTLQKGDIGLDNEARRYYKANYWESALSGPVEKQLIVQADTIGSQAILLRRNDQVILPNNVFMTLGDIDVRNDRLSISGVLNHQHVDLAVTTLYEAAIQFETDDLSTCILTDSSLAHIPVPLNLFATSQPTDAASIDISNYVDVYPMTAYSITDLPADSLEELCTLTNNLLQIVGIGEGTTQNTPLVDQTLIVAGSLLEIVHPDVNRIELYSANGQLILAKDISAHDRSLTLVKGISGLHLLRGFDQNDSMVGVQKMMIQ